jgi:hypothetical protein
MAPMIVVLILAAIGMYMVSMTLHGEPQRGSVAAPRRRFCAARWRACLGHCAQYGRTL